MCGMGSVGGVEVRGRKKKR